MGNTWVTDITHFPGRVVGEAIAEDVHPAAYRLRVLPLSALAVGTNGALAYLLRAE